MHDPSPSQSLRRFGCFAGTFRPSGRQILSTRFVVHPPAFGPQEGCNAAVAVPPILAGHPDDPLHEPWLIVSNARRPAMRIPRLSQHPACPAFGHHVAAEHVTHMLDRLPPLRLIRPQPAVLPLPR